MKKLLASFLSFLLFAGDAFAQVGGTPISGWPNASPFYMQNGDYIPITRNGVTYKATPWAFPTAGNIILSSGTGVSLTSLAEVDGYCVMGQNGSWKVLPCITGAAIYGTPSSGNLTAFITSSSIGATDLTGDVTTSGSAATTLKTVNSNTGSFGSSTAIPNFTVNGKGLITAAGTNAVVAPAGTLTGATLASGVTGSSLTSLGTIGTGTWQGTVIGATYGGTGASSAASTGVAQVSSGTWSWSTALANGTTATTQTSSDNSTKVATTAFVKGQSSASGGFVNKFRNGSMLVSQRLASMASTTCPTSAAIQIDGWYCVSTTTPADVVWQPFTVDAASGNIPAVLPSYMELLGVTGNAGVSIYQDIESFDATPLSSEVVTVQFQLVNNSLVTVTPSLTTCYASATDNFTTCTADLSATSMQSCAAGTICAEAYTFTASFNAQNGYRVTFAFGAIANTKTLYVSGFDIRGTPGVSTGLNSTPPIIEIPSFAAELARNQRYFVSTFGNAATPAQNSTLVGALGTQDYGATAGEAFTSWRFPVPMRVAPTITTYNPSASNANWRDVTGSSDVVVSVDPDSAKGMTGVLIGSTSTSLTAGHHLYIQATASAEE